MSKSNFFSIFHEKRNTFLDFSFVVLLGLATNNVMTTAIPFYHRLLVIGGGKLTVWGVTLFLAIVMLSYLLVTVNPLETFRKIGLT